ncbi:RNA-binding domain-containing protein [Faecalibaculum rodentium]|uniref:RNA-binding domain-containing protein n=2 Tax=Faecalibaculum rodentium TaxID=1702221 RepID=UPI0025A266F5|nr:RNA-binding domain-containing protein [Faecalibaculum rodentium]
MWEITDLSDKERITEQELEEIILQLKENHQIELKESTQLPKSFWETCSSFANTDSGLIILGVKEIPGERNRVTGVDNCGKVLTDMWNGMNSQNKISMRTANNEDVVVLKLADRDIVLVFIREVSMLHKPVYLNGKIENSYLRTGDGDRKASNEELKAMMRNQVPNADAQVLPAYTLDDLDLSSLRRLKELTDQRYPAQNMAAMSDADFLIRTGAATRNRKTGEFMLKAGTLLFLGKTNVIRELFPHFHLDYFEFKNGSGHRWDHRISDDDYLTGEINILTFFEKVMNRLQAIVQEPFALDENLMRRPDSGWTATALREALVNSLVHADYQMSDSAVRIEAHPNRFLFTNPGQMLINKEDFFTGGLSRPRNELLMSFFRNIGAAERQGYGGCQILESALKRDYKTPEITTSLSRTSLTVWTEGLIGLDPDLTESEKTVLYILQKESEKQAHPFSYLLEKTGLSEYYLRKSLKTLSDKNYLERIGKGRGMTYRLK